MADSIPAPTLRDDDGAPETVYLTRSASRTNDGWYITSLDVGPWRPLAVGDGVVALDTGSRDEFLVLVTDVEETGDEVLYQLRHLADLNPAAEPGLVGTRSWLRTPSQGPENGRPSGSA